MTFHRREAPAGASELYVEQTDAAAGDSVDLDDVSAEVFPQLPDLPPAPAGPRAPDE